MPHAIRMPKPGQMTEECTLILWRKEEGDVVRRGDVLFEIETDKSAMEVESFEEGVLLRRLVPEGATVPVNAVCGYVGQPGEAIPEAPDDGQPGEVIPQVPDAGRPPPEPATGAPATAPVTGAPAMAPATAAGSRLRISPRASRLAADAGLDPRTIQGSGPGGRVTERDVRAAVERTDRMAAAPAPASPMPTPATPVPPADARAQPMSRMRRTIAERLTHSWTTTPHFAVTVAVDAGRMLERRAELESRGTSLSVTDVVAEAVVEALVEYPDLNARADGTSIVRHPQVHLGLAVSVPGGLLVPVIHDAGRLSIGGIHERAEALVAAARAGTLAPDDMAGGTFTISNLGMFEVESFSAIINPGEGAILAVASAVPTPVAVGDGIAVRPIMRLTLSADHRIVDGETAARFLGAVRRRLEAADALRAAAMPD